MITTITHQKTKMVYSNLRDLNDCLLTFAACWIGMMNSCLGPKEKIWLVWKKNPSYTFVALCVVCPGNLLSIQSMCWWSSLCCLSVYVLSVSVWLIIWGISFLKLMCMHILKKWLTQAVCESKSPGLICFVKTFMSQLIRGFPWSDLNFISFVINHKLSMSIPFICTIHLGLWS